MLKHSNYRERIMKPRHNESLLPELPHQTLPPKLIYNMKFFKHKNWGHRGISPKISPPHSPTIQTTSMEVKTLKPIENTQENTNLYCFRI